MDRTMRNTLGALLVLATGCGAPDVGGAPSALLGDQTAPLPSVPAQAWMAAPPGCEGLLGGEQTFAVAASGPNLVAVLSPDGSIVCVDTLQAVEQDLQDSGHPDQARALVRAYDASTDGRFRSPNRWGDPDPEPNIGWSCVRHGDPDPEPNYL